jgi:hypothetical protein
MPSCVVRGRYARWAQNWCIYEADASSRCASRCNEASLRASGRPRCIAAAELCMRGASVDNADACDERVNAYGALGRRSVR